MCLLTVHFVCLPIVNFVRCLFRYKWISGWSRLRGLGLTRDHGFPSMTSRNPRAASDGLKHRIGTHDWVQPSLPFQPPMKLPVLRLYSPTRLVLKRDRLNGSEVNECRSCHWYFHLPFRSFLCHVPSVLWVMRCWCGYLSVARCRLFACGPADAAASQNTRVSCLI